MSCGRNCPSDWTTAFLLHESFLSVSLSFSLHRHFVLSHMRPDARSDSSSRSTILSCHMQVLMLVLAETPLPANQQSRVEGVDRCSSLVGCCQPLRDWQARSSEMSRIFADKKIMRCLPTRDPYGHAHPNLSSGGDKSRRSSSFIKSRRPTLFKIGASFALPYNSPIWHTLPYAEYRAYPDLTSRPSRTEVGRVSLEWSSFQFCEHSLCP
jgi:hypothetical protein